MLLADFSEGLKRKISFFRNIFSCNMEFSMEKKVADSICISWNADFLMDQNLRGMQYACSLGLESHKSETRGDLHMIKKSVSIFAFLSVAVLLTARVVSSAPLVSFTATGSNGNWTLDFSVTNTLGVDGLDIYYFGVALDAIDQTSPSSNWGNYNNGRVVGGITFNTVWTNSDFYLPSGLIQEGQTLSGFQVTDSAQTVPDFVPWFAFAIGLDDSGKIDQAITYTGSDNFNWAWNPGFERESPQEGGGSVPEPTTMLLFGAGLAGLAAAYRRKDA
jgi:hypothetical protein